MQKQIPKKVSLRCHFYHIFYPEVKQIEIERTVCFISGGRLGLACFSLLVDDFEIQINRRRMCDPFQLRYQLRLDLVSGNKQRETHHTHFQPLHLLTYKKERIRMSQSHKIPDHLQAVFSSEVFVFAVLEGWVEKETKMEISVH
jgi:hypothetical protein